MYEDKHFHEDDQQFRASTFLVTGGAGFVGSHIVEYLLAHGAKEVRVIDNLSEGRLVNLEHFKHDDRLRFTEADITDEETVVKIMEGVDYVSHQAALGSVPRSMKNPLATNHANVTGFLTVLDAARRANVKRFVYASSSSVYGDHPVLPKVESQIGRPLSPYAVSKRVNELYADVFNTSYGMQIVGLRYFNIFGPRQNPDGPYAAVIPLFIRSLMNGDSAMINGDGGQTRDFTYVENAVQANIRSLFTNVDGAMGKVYNIAVGERISVLEMYKILKECTGSDINATHRPEREGDIRDSLADISLANHYLGYQPEVTMLEGLRMTCDWFKKNS